MVSDWLDDESMGKERAPEVSSGRVLLICGGRRQHAPGLLNHPLIRSLSVVTTAPHAYAYDDTIRVHTVEDIEDVEAVRRAAAASMGKVPFDAVLAPYEAGGLAAAYLRSYYGLAGVTFDVALAFTSKHVMKKRLARSGVPVARHAMAHHPRQARAAVSVVGWPCVVKPLFGGGGHGVARLTGLADLQSYLQREEVRALWDKDGALVFEPYVPVLNEYHCDGIVSGGKVVFVSPARYMRPVLEESGHVGGSMLLPRTDADHSPLVRVHKRVVAALGIRDAVTHLEAFGTEEGIVVGEVAARPAGGGIPDAIRLHHGVDLLDATIRLQLGETVQVRPRRRSGYFVNCHLPLRPGLVTAITPTERLADLPDVALVDMNYVVGDEIPDQLNSASAAGVLHFAASTLVEVKRRVADIADRYQLEVVTPDGERHVVAESDPHTEMVAGETDGLSATDLMRDNLPAARRAVKP